MKSMDERRAAIKKQLRGGKRNTLRELSEAIGEERERTRAAVKKMCALGELIQEGDGVRGQKAVYLLTRVGKEENDEELDKPDDRRMVDGIWAGRGEAQSDVACRHPYQRRGADCAPDGPGNQ